MVVCVNKMDLVDWDQARFERDQVGLHGVRRPPRTCTTSRSSRSPRSRATTSSSARSTRGGTTGSPLLNHLESVYIASDENFIDPRFPVQYVIRARRPRTPTSGAMPARWPAGCSARATRSSSCPPGITSRIAPSRPPTATGGRGVPADGGRHHARGRHRRVARRRAVPPNNRPTLTHDLEATVCWMDERLAARTWAAATCSSTARGRCGPRPQSLQYRLDINGLHRDEDADSLGAQRDRPRHVPLHRAADGRRLHDQPRHRQLHRHRPRHQRHVGRRGHPGHRRPRTPARTWCATGAPVARRALRRPGHDGRHAAVHRPVGGRQVDPGRRGGGGFVRSGRPAFLLDGDNLRHGLNGDLGFSDRDRTENVRRAAEVARMFAESGAWRSSRSIGPFEDDRRLIRALHDEAGLSYRRDLSSTPRSRSASAAIPRASTPGRARASCPGSPASTPPTRCPGLPDLRLGPDSGSLPEQVSRVLEASLEDLLHRRLTRGAAGPPQPRTAATSAPRQPSHPSRWEGSRSAGRSWWVRFTIVPPSSATSTTSTVLLPGGSVGVLGYPPGEDHPVGWLHGHVAAPGDRGPEVDGERPPGRASRSARCRSR